MIEQVKKITDTIHLELFGTQFSIRVERDNKNPENGRILIQIVYNSKCTESGEVKEWHGRKWYLSEHMTEDEVVKTAYAAFKACIEHEVMEAFKIEGVKIFNPHVSYKALLSVSNQIIHRTNL